MKSDEGGVRVLVVGEVLWDRFSDSTRLGGAPLNFAVQLKRLQHTPVLISALGADAPGEEARRTIGRLGLDTSFLQSTKRFPTGSARVHIDPSGRTSFVIDRPAAYDAVALSEDDVRQISRLNPDWFYYGTLFPSCPRSKGVLEQLLLGLPAPARFYDLNLRPGFASPDLVSDLLRSADVVKLNEEELGFAHEFLDLPEDPERFCRAGSYRFNWRAACVTLGARGCAMLVGDDYVVAQGVPVDVGDPVGAGDAFAAAFVHGLISNWSAAETARFANQTGARVASVHGAIPDVTPDVRA